MKARARALLATLLLFGVVGACGDKRVGSDDVVGEWEKQDNSLPPIHLVLSKNGTQILARLRLSGVELNGTATLEGDQLRLNLPGHEDMMARFTSKTTLQLWLGNDEFLLLKRP